MDRLHPARGPAEDLGLDPYDAYRPEDPRAPLVRINMVTSLEGRVVGADGRSGGLGGAGDEAAFFAMRALADAVVVGAGTVRAEGYGPMRPRPVWEGRRRADGRTGPVPVVVVSASLDLDLAASLFTEAVAPTVVLTCADSAPDRRAAAARAGAVVVPVGEGRVDLVAGIATLRERHGLHHLLVEGGPSLNGQLLDAGLVDELCLTLAPAVVGGEDPRRAVDGATARHDLVLAQVLRDGDELLLRYRRPDDGDQKRRSSSDSMPLSAS
jgi:riboflavin-specific deaminase-like protein